MRVAYLGPPGTFTEDALRLYAAIHGEQIEPEPMASVHETILAVERGEVERGFVPFENSIEGTVRTTLDALALDTKSVTIIGEHDYAVHQSLMARRPLGLDEVTVVISHPQGNAQCARFLRKQLPQAEVRTAASTAEAIRIVSESKEPWAALGAEAAAEIYGCVVLQREVEDEARNVTRFIYIASAGVESPGDGPMKTSLVFSELGEDHPGALVDALGEFSGREINLTRIESRPMRQEFGRYMFFVDLDGGVAEPEVAAAIEALRDKAESVRILGSYPAAPSA